MPPKKKAGKKGGGKKKDKEKADENTGEGEAVSELDKYYYLTQIEVTRETPVIFFLSRYI